MGYRDNLGKHAILKRITGLKSVQYKSRPAKYESTREAHARKDPDYDGNFLEDFNQNVIPGAVTGLAPHWNDLKDTYWVEDIRILHDIVENGPIRIRYPNNHPDKPGKLIKAEEIDPRNYWDPFFQELATNDQAVMKRMESGKYTFELQKDPIDALLFYCYKNDPTVVVKDGREYSKYSIGRAKFELIIPREEMLENKNTLKREIDALTLLGSCSYEKQKIIARVMGLRLNDYNNPDPDTLYVELGRAARSDKKIPKWGVTEQDKFVTLSKMPNEDLMLHLDIVKAIEMRIITNERNDWMLNFEKLESVTDEMDLFSFFKEDNNSDKYKDLLFLIEEKEKQPI